MPGLAAMARPRVLLLSLAALAVMACTTTNGDVGPECSPILSTYSEPDSLDSHPLRLVACVLDAEVRVGDPIRIYVGLINVSNRPVNTLATLDLGSSIGMTVTDDGGYEQDYYVGEPDYYPDPLDLRRWDIVIPRGGSFGRVLDLGCDPGAYRAGEGRCHMKLSLDRPGKYQITTRYWALCGFRECPYGLPLDSETLTAAPVTLRLLPSKDP